VSFGVPALITKSTKSVSEISGIRSLVLDRLPPLAVRRAVCP
jgi:hypothetical protein